MTLTLDAGNSTIAGGVFDGDKLVLHFRQTTSQNSTSDELGIFLRSVLRENGIDPAQISDIGICSVVPPINYSLSNAIVKYFGKDALFIQAGIKTGLKLRLANPKEIGSDLIAGAIGALAIYPNRNLIIIDMGTATTLSLVTKNREYLGGSILAGMKISVQALATQTSKLPEVEISMPEKPCGTSTISAIQSGSYYGTIGAIKELCRMYKKESFRVSESHASDAHNSEPFVVATGGFAKIFESAHLFDAITPDLVLYGVKCALEMNRQ